MSLKGGGCFDFTCSSCKGGGEQGLFDNTVATVVIKRRGEIILIQGRYNDYGAVEVPIKNSDISVSVYPIQFQEFFDDWELDSDSKHWSTDKYTVSDLSIIGGKIFCWYCSNSKPYGNDPEEYFEDYDYYVYNEDTDTDSDTDSDTEDDKKHLISKTEYATRSLQENRGFKGSSHEFSRILDNGAKLMKRFPNDYYPANYEHYKVPYAWSSSKKSSKQSSKKSSKRRSSKKSSKPNSKRRSSNKPISRK